jgi:hypothetical protein
MDLHNVKYVIAMFVTVMVVLQFSGLSECSTQEHPLVNIKFKLFTVYLQTKF